MFSNVFIQSPFIAVIIAAASKFFMLQRFWTCYKDDTHRPLATAQKLGKKKKKNTPNCLYPLREQPNQQTLHRYVNTSVLSLSLGSRGEKEKSGLEIHFLRAGNALPALAAQQGLQSHSWYHNTGHNPFSQIWYRRKLKLGLSYHPMLHHRCLFGVLKPSSSDSLVTSEKCYLTTKGQNQCLKLCFQK